MEERVLVVDDDPAVLGLLLGVFRNAGLHADGLSDGQEAFDRLRLGGYKLLITDVHLPGLNGIDLISRTHRLFPGMEALAMSGFGTEATKEKLDRLGIFGFVEKPIDVAALSVLAKKALKSDRLIRLHYLHHQPVVCMNRCHVLVADDSPAFLKMVGDFLTSHNYRIKTVNNGSQAYEDLLINDYDAIMLDINMPVMDGVEAVKAIRENDPDTFILVVSGEADSSEIADAMRSGANRFLPKPFDFNDLLGILEKVDFRRIASAKRSRSQTEIKKQLSSRPWHKKVSDYFKVRNITKWAALYGGIMALCLLAGYVINTLARHEEKTEDESLIIQKLDGVINALREDTRIDSKK